MTKHILPLLYLTNLTLRSPQRGQRTVTGGKAEVMGAHADAKFELYRSTFQYQGPLQDVWLLIG